MASMASEGSTGIPVFGRRRQSIPKPSLILLPSCVLWRMDCLQDLLKRRTAKGTSKVLSTHRAIIRERNRPSERRAWRGMNEIKIYFSQVSECHTDTSYFVQMLGEGKNKRRGNVWGYFSKRNIARAERMVTGPSSSLLKQFWIGYQYTHVVNTEWCHLGGEEISKKLQLRKCGNFSYQMTSTRQEHGIPD